MRLRGTDAVRDGSEHLKRVTVITGGAGGIGAGQRYKAGYLTGADILCDRGVIASRS